MEKIAPLGPVYQAGTLSGNPVAVAAGLATLAQPKRPASTRRLRSRTRAFTRGHGGGRAARGRRRSARKRSAACSASISRRSVPDSYDAVMACDKERFNRFFHAMLDAGIYLAPSAFEAGFVSAAHGTDDIAQTIRAAEAAFAHVRLRMPELPDVELYREALDARVLGQTLRNVALQEPVRAAHGGAAARCAVRAHGARRVERIGKRIVLALRRRLLPRRRTS